MVEVERNTHGIAVGGLTTGVIGTALGALNSGLIPGLFGGNAAAACSENMGVNRYELSMQKELTNKDMEIAYWRGQDETNRKISDTYANLEGQINALAREVRCNKDEQTGINMQQAVYNGTNTAAMTCMQGQIAQLYSLTKLIVPNGSVCPGWGDVTITPTTPAAGG